MAASCMEWPARGRLLHCGGRCRRACRRSRGQVADVPPPRLAHHHEREQRELDDVSPHAPARRGDGVYAEAPMRTDHDGRRRSRRFHDSGSRSFHDSGRRRGSFDDRRWWWGGWRRRGLRLGHGRRQHEHRGALAEELRRRRRRAGGRRFRGRVRRGDDVDARGFDGRVEHGGLLERPRAERVELLALEPAGGLLLAERPPVCRSLPSAHILATCGLLLSKVSSTSRSMSERINPPVIAWRLVVGPPTSEAHEPQRA